MIDLAAQVYPHLFSNGTEVRQHPLGYLYRYFSASGIYVGVKDGNIYLMGGSFGSSPVNKGAIAAVNSALQTAKANLAKTTTPVSGLYDLTVSGTFRTSLISISIPSIKINDIPAPGVSDTKSFEDAVKTLGATNISSLTVQVINNTSSRVTFRVQFNATLPAPTGNVAYDLTYDYVL